MIDPFVLLTPVLLLPIALLFFFVGCSLLFEAAEPETATESDDPEVTFDITFWVENTREDHRFEFKIRDSMTDIAGDDPDTIDVLEAGQGNSPSQVRHRFSRFLEPNPVTLSCEVVDRDDDDNETPLVSGGDCAHDLIVDEQYLARFEAGRQGNNPDSEFAPCDIAPL
jgi:hypothetical protein